MRNLKLLPLMLLLSATATLAASEDGKWKYSTGIDYSSGDYGGDPVDTDITYLPFTASWKSSQWTLKATVPWVSINGAGTVIGAGDGGVVVGNPNRRGNGNSNGNSGNGGDTPTASRETGLGDIWVGATYAVESVPPELFYLDLGAKIKLPTADDAKGLGTGEMDYTFQADIFKPLGQYTPFFTLAYKVKGDPQGIDLDNVFYLSAGNDFRVSDHVNWGVSLDYQQATTVASDDALELFGYVNRKISNTWGVMFYGYTGLQDGSPDYGVGLQLSYRPQN